MRETVYVKIAFFLLPLGSAVTTDIGSALTYRKNLTDFQIEKFTYMFNYFFDLDKNELIETADIYALAEKMRQVT